MKTQGTDKKSLLKRVASKLEILQYIAFAILLYGIKLRVIVSYGGATPYWDQWDGEAANLYSPFLKGSLGLKELFAPHNEHRIFITRIYSLLLLKINGFWSPAVQMVVNAVLHIGAILLAVHLLLKATDKKYSPIYLLFSFFLFVVPYAWENTLGGFQSQFYFVLIFSITTLWFTTTSNPLSGKWWIGLLCSVLAFLSIASGVFAAGAACVIGIIYFITGAQRNLKQAIAILVLGAFMAAGLYLTPTIAAHAQFKAANFNAFYTAFINTFSWPLKTGLFTAILRNLPALAFTGVMLWKRPASTDKRWFLLGLIIWVLGQSFSIAYGRATVALSSRYLDLFALGVLANFACLISLLHPYFQKRSGLAYAGLILWAGLVCISLRLVGNGDLNKTLANKRRQTIAQELNVKKYLETGDVNVLKKKGFYDIPFPSADGLVKIIDQPEIKAILPSNLIKDHIGTLDVPAYWLLGNYNIFIVIGLIGTGFIAFVIVFNRDKKPAPVKNQSKKKK
jgi:hypothetical protein